jgi:hypothetical protein
MRGDPAPFRRIARGECGHSGGHPNRRVDSPTEQIVANRILVDRAEFVDALRLLRKGHVLVRTGDQAGGCVLDGAIVYHSYPALLRYGLIGEFHNPAGFAGAQYFRLTPLGREFAQRVSTQWRSRSVWERLAVRLVG